MKLSSMPTEKAFDAMVAILPYAVEILEDEEFARIKGAMRGAKENRLPVSEVVNKAMPAVISKHRNAFFNIVAALCGTNVDAVKKELTFGECVKEFTDSWDDLNDFFCVCVRLAASV